MSTKRHKPEEIVSKLGQVDVPVVQGMSGRDALRQVSITEQTCKAPILCTRLL